jgi:hypothetical protein
MLEIISSVPCIISLINDVFAGAHFMTYWMESWELLLFGSSCQVQTHFGSDALHCWLWTIEYGKPRIIRELSLVWFLPSSRNLQISLLTIFGTTKVRPTSSWPHSLVYWILWTMIDEIRLPLSKVGLQTSYLISTRSLVFWLWQYCGPYMSMGLKLSSHQESFIIRYRSMTWGIIPFIFLTLDHTIHTIFGTHTDRKTREDFYLFYNAQQNPIYLQILLLWFYCFCCPEYMFNRCLLISQIVPEACIWVCINSIHI